MKASNGMELKFIPDHGIRMSAAVNFAFQPVYEYGKRSKSNIYIWREPGPGSKYSLISQPVFIHCTDSYANTSFHIILVLTTESSQLKKLCDAVL